MAFFEVVEDLAEAEESHGHGHEVDAVTEVEVVEGEPFGSGEDIAADHRKEHSDGSGDQRLDLVAGTDGGNQGDAEKRQCCVLGRSEIERETGDQRSQEGEPEDRRRSADERTDGGDSEGRSGTSLFGHLKAIEDSDDSAGFTGQSQQHRGDRAAVLCPVEDAGEHDDGSDRFDTEGHRQKDGHCRGRSESGKHTDEHADEDADETVQKVSGFEDGAEPFEDWSEYVHVFVLLRRDAAAGCGVPRRR